MIANEIRENLLKVCRTLNKHAVEYIIIGRVAVGYHGYQRISGISFHRPEIKSDFDFWYKPSTDNFVKLIAALKEIGVDEDQLDHIIFDPRRTFLKIPHKEFNTDFLPEMIGIDDFNMCRNRAEVISLENTQIVIMSLTDLTAINSLCEGRLNRMISST